MIGDLVVLYLAFENETSSNCSVFAWLKSRPFLKTVNTKLFMGEKRNYKILGSLQTTQNFPQ